MKRLLTVLTGVALASSAYGASAIIKSGDVYLGVNDLGHLNAPDTYGVTINSPLTGVTLGRVGDATSPGCYCEGWGVSGGAVSGFASIDLGGSANLTLSSFASDDVGAAPGTFATSVVTLDGSTLEVTQRYAAAAAAPGALFANSVTIKNTGAATVSDVRYVRVMDWDIPPTEFSEFVTIQGTATTTQLELSHNNGFSNPDPLGITGEILAGTTDVDFVDVGPADHGAYFKFNFGDLEPGESQEFTIFYGGANNEAAALAALGAVGIELYSLGQSTNSAGGVANDSATFMFGFKGVGGEIIVPPVPEGGTTLVLLGSVMGGLMLARRRFAVKA